MRTTTVKHVLVIKPIPQAIEPRPDSITRTETERSEHQREHVQIQNTNHANVNQTWVPSFSNLRMNQNEVGTEHFFLLCAFSSSHNGVNPL